jgi:hypothetical protein
MWCLETGREPFNVVVGPPQTDAVYGGNEDGGVSILIVVGLKLKPTVEAKPNPPTAHCLRLI